MAWKLEIDWPNCSRSLLYFTDASKAPLAVAYAKRAANMVDLMPQRDAYRFEQEFTVALSKTEDAREARAAFLEKRAPVFKGR